MTAPRDLIKAATPLPWRLVPWNDGYLVKGPQGTRFEHTILVDYSDPEDVSAELADARLILAAVNNLPALLDVADALERLLDEFDYWTSEPRPAIDGGTVRLHKFGEVQPEMERKYEQARAALARLENQP